MAAADAPAAPRERLVRALRAVLEAHPGSDPHDAERLACLLVAREQYARAVGGRPGGSLEGLPPPFAGLPPTAAVRTALDAVRRSLEDRAVDPASIGDGYEVALGSAMRGVRGQFFTPRPLADGLVDWALAAGGPDGGPPRVLDPAAGTGTFLLAAFERLRGGPRDDDPGALLGRLVGVDVDGVALQLAGLRLGAAAGQSVPGGALHHASFFDCVPAGSAPDGRETVSLSPVDAVVGNPPFVRAEDLDPDLDHFRRHLRTFGPAGASPLFDGPDAFSRRSDAYVYFVTQATRFLRPGGRLAVVLPTKWLMSEYGRGLRRFLRERYRVRAIVGFDRRAFGEALVDTALLFAERAAGDVAAGPMRFVRLDEPPGPAALGDAVSGEGVPAPAAQVAERPQAGLTGPGSLARYLEAPPELLTMFESPAFVRLDGLAEVARGSMTGANRFFFVDASTVDRFGLEPRFLRPAVKSLRSVDRPAVESADVDRQLVAVHPYVAAARRGADGTREPTAVVKDALETDGYGGLLAYVEHAEAEGWHTGRTCQSRPVWFDLGPLRAPAAFVPKLLRERVFAVRNTAGAVPSNAIDGIWPAEDVDPGALLAVLCSSLGKAAMEVTGRDEAGLLQLMTYETASLPTPDVRACSAADRQSLAAAGEAYAERRGPATLAALDEAVAAAFDLPLAAATIREHARSLRRRRIDGAEPASVTAD